MLSVHEDRFRSLWSCQVFSARRTLSWLPGGRMVCVCPGPGDHADTARYRARPERDGGGLAPSHTFSVWVPRITSQRRQLCPGGQAQDYGFARPSGALHLPHAQLSRAAPAPSCWPGGAFAEHVRPRHPAPGLHGPERTFSGRCRFVCRRPRPRSRPGHAPGGLASPSGRSELCWPLFLTPATAHTAAFPSETLSTEVATRAARVGRSLLLHQRRLP